jgi:hypothetical protein
MLLINILTRTIPLCQSPAYKIEWGPPNTKKRYNKLINVLQTLIFVKRNEPGHERALIEWKEDMIYLRENHRDKFPKTYIN